MKLFKKIMEKVYHYTSQTNWEKICKKGVLLPKSRGAPLFGPVSDRVRLVVGNRNYLACLDSPIDEGWIQTGLMPYLVKHTTGEVMLEIPILNRKRAFVRDYSLESPEAYIEECGRDLFALIYIKDDDAFPDKF